MWPWIRRDLGSALEAASATGTADAGKGIASGDLVRGLRDGTVDFDEIPGIASWLTPESQFYYVSKNLTPFQIRASEWGALEIGGQVGRPISFALEELKRLPRVELHATLICIDYDPKNPRTRDLVSNGLWTGVSLRSLLERAQVKPEASELVLKAADGYSDSLALEQVWNHEDVILAWALNGKPLSAQHGYPLRLVVPGIYGMKNVKHVQKLIATDQDYRGYWQRRGWADEAPVRTMSKIETPVAGEVFPLGEPVIVAGVAFGGARGISRVELSRDGGQSWGGSILEPNPSPYSWTRWAHLWEPSQAGEHTLVVRATDGTGQRQERAYHKAFPDGATGYHRVRVRVSDIS